MGKKDHVNKFPLVDEWTSSNPIARRYKVQGEKEKGMYVDFARGCNYNIIDPSKGKKYDTINKFIITRIAYNNALDEKYIPYFNHFVEFFDTDRTFMCDLLKVKYLIDISNEDKEYPLASFKHDLLTYILCKETMANIKAFVEDQCYISTTGNKKKYSDRNDAMEFTHDHYIALWCASMAIKLCIPIISHYYAKKKHTVIEDYLVRNKVSDQYDMKHFALDMFTMIMTHVSPEVDLYNKLRETVALSIKRQDATNKNRQEYQGYSDNNGIIRSMHSVITEIIPKFVFTEFGINLISVSIRERVSSTYNSKSKILYYEMKHSNETEEGGLGRLEAECATIEDLDIMIKKENTKQVIKKLAKKYNVEFDKEEMKFYSDNLKKMHHISKVFEFFVPYFGSPFDLKAPSRNTQVKLIILFKKMMDDLGFIYMQHIATGKISDRVSNRKLSQKKITELSKTDRYKYLIKHVYSDTNDCMEDNDVTRALAQIINNKITIIDYDPELNGKDIEPNQDILCDEYINFELMCE